MSNVARYFMVKAVAWKMFVMVPWPRERDRGLLPRYGSEIEDGQNIYLQDDNMMHIRNIIIFILKPIHLFIINSEQ